METALRERTYREGNLGENPYREDVISGNSPQGKTYRDGVTNGNSPQGKTL